MKVKEEREKTDLKLNIQTTKIMAFGSVTSWQIVGETVETVTEFILPRQHIQKQRHYFANKGPCSQGYGFSSGHVWM